MKLYRVYSWAYDPPELHSLEVVEQPSRYKAVEESIGLSFDCRNTFPKDRLEALCIALTPEEAIALEAKRCQHVIRLSEAKAQQARDRLELVQRLKP